MTVRLREDDVVRSHQLSRRAEHVVVLPELESRHGEVRLCSLDREVTMITDDRPRRERLRRHVDEHLTKGRLDSFSSGGISASRILARQAVRFSTIT